MVPQRTGHVDACPCDWPNDIHEHSAVIIYICTSPLRSKSTVDSNSSFVQVVSAGPIISASLHT